MCDCIGNTKTLSVPHDPAWVPTDAGTEHAVMRHIAASPRLWYVGSLDLKSAFNSVPSDQLIARINKTVSTSLSNMILLTIQPLAIKTKHNNTNTACKIIKSVTQGSPRSSALFNIYMDTYIEQLHREATSHKNVNPDAQWACTLFADDFKPQSVSPTIFQALLDVLGRWADGFGMQWSPSKRHILQPFPHFEKMMYKLSGDYIKVNTEGTYLEMSITSDCKIVTTSIVRVQRERAKLKHLARHCDNVHLISVWHVILICKTLTHNPIRILCRPSGTKKQCVTKIMVRDEKRNCYHLFKAVPREK